MEKNIHFLLFLLLALFFLGCNSGESNNPALNQNTDPTTIDVRIQGYIVDGYIQGADVCIDKNYNTICDTSEQIVKSTSSGYFSLPATKVLESELLLLSASNGTDTTSGKAFNGHLRSVVYAKDHTDTLEYFINPLSDLVATSFLDSSSQTITTLQTAKALIADGYRVGENMVNANPMSDVAVFVVGQDIQQTKQILEEVAVKANGFTLTSAAMKQLRTNVKRAMIYQIQESESRFFEEEGLIASLEKYTDINVSSDMEIFVEAQLPKVREAIYRFNEEQHTLEELKSFQNALETEVDKILDIIDLHASGIPLPPFALEIDITIDIEDENTTTPIDENTTTDANVTYDVSGVMADGYISGATVYVDKDSSGGLDSGETSVSTSAEGAFLLSELSLLKDKFYPIVGVGGTDTATGKSFERVYRAVLETAESSTIVSVLSPLSDMIGTLFFRSSSKDKAAYTSATTLIAAKFDVDQNKVLGDPMKDKKIFTTSIGLESIKTVLERLISSKKTLTLYGKEQIKEALLEQILASSYADFNPSRVLTTVDIRSGMVLDTEDKAFATDMIENIKETLEVLYMDTNIKEELYPRLQKLLDTALTERIAQMEYQDLNLTAERVSYSVFDKANAVHDPLSCSNEGGYTKSLVSLSSEGVPVEDSTNGIMIGFDSQPETGVEAIEIYYPPLGVSRQLERVVVFKDNYYFSYDKAWIDTQKSIYLRSPRKEGTAQELYDCYKIALDKEFGIDVQLQKVYRYTDM